MAVHDYLPKTSRIEAFTDGVMAIILTIMVFELKSPQLNNSTLSAEMVKLAPKVVSFVISFLLVITFWVHHHQLFHVLARTDRKLMWYNNVFLLFLSFVPFTTAFVGDYPRLPMAVALYGIVLALAALAATLMYRHAALVAGLMIPQVPRAERERTARKYFGAPVLYAVAVGLAFVPGWGVRASLAIYVIILILFMVPERIRREDDEPAE